MVATNYKKKMYTSGNAGFTVLVATIVAAIVLAIGLVILDITFKQVRLSGIARESEIAFQAASATLECVRFQDLRNSTFDLQESGGIVSATCFGTSASNSNSNGSDPVGSGDEQIFSWTWGSGELCSRASVYKFHNENNPVDMESVGIYWRDCSVGATCTVIKARGYNKSCANVGDEGTVERELTVFY